MMQVESGVIACVCVSLFMCERERTGTKSGVYARKLVITFNLRVNIPQL